MIAILLHHKVEFVFALLATASAFIGDSIESQLKHGFMLAFVDNFTHFVIACFTWASVSSSRRTTLFAKISEILLCGVMASFLDVDHFLAANSLNINDATRLKQRPMFHNTTIIIITSSLLLSLSKVTSTFWLWTFGWLLIAAGISHHTRDAYRRGFWFWPLGSTPPLSTTIYLGMITLLPFMITTIQKLIPASDYRKVSIEIV